MVKQVEKSSAQRVAAKPVFDVVAGGQYALIGKRHKLERPKSEIFPSAGEDINFAQTSLMLADFDYEGEEFVAYYDVVGAKKPVDHSRMNTSQLRLLAAQGITGNESAQLHQVKMTLTQIRAAQAAVGGNDSGIARSNALELEFAAQLGIAGESKKYSHEIAKDRQDRILRGWQTDSAIVYRDDLYAHYHGLEF